MDALEAALNEIVKELENEHEFYFEETGEGELKAAIRKHLFPLVNYDKYKKQQIATLRAQLAALDA